MLLYVLLVDGQEEMQRVKVQQYVHLKGLTIYSVILFLTNKQMSQKNMILQQHTVKDHKIYILKIQKFW